MPLYTVKMGKISPIGSGGPLETRTMERTFGTAKAASALACDLLYVLQGSDAANGHSDKYYTVSRDRPRVSYQSSARDFWVEVTYVDVMGGRGRNKTPA